MVIVQISEKSKPRARWSGTGARSRAFASYDAARTTDDNRRHWINADHLSGLAATRADIRRTLRSRARYEVANNSYAKGIIRTLADYIVGTGPRLQMLTDQPDVNRFLEREFAAWALAIDLPRKLHTMRMGQTESGECFGRFRSNPFLPSPVQLDFALVECDQVASPWPSTDPSLIDGVRLDAFGQPVAYHVLNHHPGDNLYYTGMSFDGAEVPASLMVHLFRAERPGQIRGVPEITPSLPLFAMMRRFTLATIAAAETAANWAGVLKTEAPGGADDDDYAKPMDVVEVERNSLVALPYGTDLKQLEAEHPATTYAMFKREIISEIARCLNMPYAIAAGDSSEHNYASGRLDYQAFFKSIDIEQTVLERVVLDRIFLAWFAEAVLIEGYLPQSLRMQGVALPHQWFWDGIEHVDPQKEANAQATRLANNTTTLAHEWARAGLDWEDQLRQRAREVALIRELGLSEAPPTNRAADENDDEEETTTSARRAARAAATGRRVPCAA